MFHIYPRGGVCWLNIFSPPASDVHILSHRVQVLCGTALHPKSKEVCYLAWDRKMFKSSRENCFSKDITLLMILFYSIWSMNWSPLTLWWEFAQGHPLDIFDNVDIGGCIRYNFWREVPPHPSWGGLQTVISSMICSFTNLVKVHLLPRTQFFCFIFFVHLIFYGP